jgi:hypothetical protein
MTEIFTFMNFNGQSKAKIQACGKLNNKRMHQIVDCASLLIAKEKHGGCLSVTVHARGRWVERFSFVQAVTVQTCYIPPWTLLFSLFILKGD